MDIRELVRVIIPVYKSPDKYERISLKQCFQVLRNHPITLICSNSCNIAEYCNLANECGKRINIERFNNVFFENIAGYNRLMLSFEFYSKFKTSKYILIYQTDAFVFKDELIDWCDMNYDYIGAPWPQIKKEWISKEYPFIVRKFYKTIGINHVPKIGNGGFSLRKVSTFISNLKLFRNWAKKTTLNEDVFFSHCVNLLNPFFNVAPYKESVRFSFDASPEHYFRLNNNQLPFGCHGWSRNDDVYLGNFDFYKPVVNALGYEIN